jgi:hypothetical protein
MPRHFSVAEPELPASMCGLRRQATHWPSGSPIPLYFASLQQAKEFIAGHFGTPTVLINNAAIDSPPSAPPEENGPFEDYPEESWDKVMDVNLKGVYLCCQVFGATMAKAGQGSIINVASIYGVVSPDQSLYEYRRQRGEVFFKPVAYSASKSGILNLTRYLAVYWGRCASQFIDHCRRLQSSGTSFSRCLLRTHSHAPDGQYGRVQRGGTLPGE